MKKPLNEEFKRMQQLAGINEIKVRAPNNVGIDLLDYDYKEYTPEDVRNAIKNNDDSVLDYKNSKYMGFTVESGKFMQAMKEYIRDAGYEFSEEFWDSVEGGATDADDIVIFDIEDLKRFSNFTMNDAIKDVEDGINAAIENDFLEEMGLPEDTTSIEDFKNFKIR